MSALAGSARPQNEVDEVEWLTVADACKRLSFERDREVLAALAPLRT
jgi:hypothetical protein